MPQVPRQSEIPSPSIYYGAIHLTRLFGESSFYENIHVAYYETCCKIIKYLRKNIYMQRSEI